MNISGGYTHTLVGHTGVIQNAFTYEAAGANVINALYVPFHFSLFNLVYPWNISTFSSSFIEGY